MKNNIGIIFLFSISSLFAQEDYGLRNVAGGFLSFHLKKDQYHSYFEGGPDGQYLENPNRIIAVQPYAAWKYGRKTLIGIRLGFRNERESRTSSRPSGTKYTVKRYVNTFTVGVFSRHYLSPEKAFRFFLEPSASYSRVAKYKEETEVDKERQFLIKDYRLTLSPGAAYQLSPHFVLLAKFGQVGVQTGREYKDQGTDFWYKDIIADFNPASLALGVEFRF